MNAFTVGKSKAAPAPPPPSPLLPDPNAPGVTWYEDEAGNLIPGAGTYYDIVAQNIESVIIVADNIDTIIEAVDAEEAAKQAAADAAASAAAAGSSAADASSSATLATSASITAQNAATDAAGSATAAAGSASAAAGSAAAADAAWRLFNALWYGSYPSDPSVDPFGGLPTAGDAYFNTTSNKLRVYGTTGWQDATSSIPGGALISQTPPASAPGSLWWDSTGGQLYVRFDDGDSQQWVAASNLQGVGRSGPGAAQCRAQPRPQLDVQRPAAWCGAVRGNRCDSADRWVRWFTVCQSRRRHEF